MTEQFAEVMKLFGAADPVYPRSKRLIDRAPDPVFAAMFWTMSRVRSFRELLATGGAEYAALIDTMLAAAPPSTPRLGREAIGAMKPT